MLHCLSWLPLGAVRKAGHFCGALSWFFGSRMTATTRTNLALCYHEKSESERQLLARDSICNTFQTMAECGPVWLWPTQNVLDCVLEVEGLALLEASQARQKGTVVIAPHLGNWEVFGLFLNQCGCGPSSQLYQAPRDERLGRLIYQARSRSGANMVATNRKGVISLLSALKSGEIVGILPDQVPDDASGGEFAPFFGQPALTMTLVSRLLQKTGAGAVIGVAVRIRQQGRQGWKIIFRPTTNEIYAEHMRESVTALNQSIEAVVNEFPAQYQWEYKRFKRVPPGQKRPY